MAEEDTPLNLQGIAQLCMFELERNAQIVRYFQGHFVDLLGKTNFGLMGVGADFLLSLLFSFCLNTRSHAPFLSSPSFFLLFRGSFVHG
jgi:hypothetical protein